MRATGEVDIESLAKEIPAAVTAELEANAIELELGLAAYLPDTWIPSQDERVELLRKFAGIESESDAQETLSMLRDRYGRVPAEAQTLVHQFVLRAQLFQLGMRQLAYRDDTYLIQYSDRIVLERAIAGKDVELRPLRAGQAHLVIPPEHRSPVKALAWFQELLSSTLRPA